MGGLDGVEPMVLVDDVSMGGFACNPGKMYYTTASAALSINCFTLTPVECPGHYLTIW